MNPLDNGQLARSKAQDVLSGCGIAFTDDVNPSSMRNGITVGIAFYSRSDLELPDQLVRARRKRSVADSTSAVLFDVLSCRRMEDFEKFIPGIGSVYQTPAFGIWKNGQVLETGTGARGRMLLSQAIPVNREQQ